MNYLRVIRDEYPGGFPVEDGAEQSGWIRQIGPVNPQPGQKVNRIGARLILCFADEKKWFVNTVAGGAAGVPRHRVGIAVRKRAPHGVLGVWWASGGNRHQDRCRILALPR